jgi:transcriptional regulator with XRE-family HTH domain
MQEKKMAKDRESEKKRDYSQAKQPDSSSAQGTGEAGTRGVAPGEGRNTADAPTPKKPQSLPAQTGEEGSNVQDKVVSYGQQLRYERGLRGWTQEQLAEKLGTTVLEVQKWETDSSALDFASRQKLTKLLGNDFYLSSQVKATPDGMALQVRIVQRLPAAQDFTTIISALTRLHTQFWLIQQSSLADLIEFAQTQDRRFFEKANLIIENLASNSPALITFLTDPGTVTTAVASGVTLALALNKVIDAITQAWNKIVDAKIETRKKEAEQRNKEAEERRKQVEEAVATLTKVIDELRPGADLQTRAMMLQVILPDYVECLNGKGRKLDLSPLIVCP